MGSMGVASPSSTVVATGAPCPLRSCMRLFGRNATFPTFVAFIRTTYLDSPSAATFTCATRPIGSDGTAELTTVTFTLDCPALCPSGYLAVSVSRL